MAYDFTRLRLGNYDCTWNAVAMGAVDKVTPNLELITKEKKVGSLGNLVIGHWIIGLGGDITCEFREVDLTHFQKMMPWYVSGNIPLVPATWHKDLYDYAATLILHPNDLPAATLTQDVVLTKCVPMFKFPDRDGENPDKPAVKFMFYPDRSQLTVAGAPVLSYGTFGNVA